MKKLRYAVLLAMLAALQPACKTWATKGQHTINVVAIRKVNRGEDFTFTVHVKDGSGQDLKKVEFEYKIDWVGLPGATHKGKSGILQSIRVKGQPGKATLYILGYDGDNFGEIARHEFDVD